MFPGPVHSVGLPCCLVALVGMAGQDRKRIQGLFPQGLCRGVSICLSLAGRPRALVLVKEQSRHFRQSGEGGRSDPVSGCVVFWACMAFFCWFAQCLQHMVEQEK